MPMMICTYEKTDGSELEYSIPIDKISHLTKEKDIDGYISYSLTTMGGAKLALGKNDFEQARTILQERGKKKQ